ncbi:MAG: HEAT repeat domain-containing protein [Cyclobacteriaceae bacterium]
MANRFIGALQIKSEEQKQIWLMLTTGFFMGVFIATYQVTADSLFLNRLGDQLNKAFLMAGAFGILSTALFSFFQNWIKFTTLALVSILFIFAFTLAAYLLLHFGDPAWHNHYIFAMYCMSGPMTAILLLSFWGIFGRLFNFRQSKRIIGWIDTGQLIAAMVATLVIIPLTSRLVSDTSNYLLLCCVSIFIVSILLITIASFFSLAKNDPAEFGPLVRKETSLNRLFTDRYILSLSFFLLISMVTLMFSQYAFQEMVRQQYPNERELTTFNSFFTGAVYGLSLIMQTFINNRVISNYGLRISLFILPLVVGLFALGAVVVGTALGFSRDVSAAGFIYFFLFVALSRLFNWTLRDSLENPVFKLFFIPLDNRYKFNIQSKVEGLVNESARFIAGVLIFSFAFIPQFKIIHISVLILVLVAAYFIIINTLYHGYRNKIRQKLETTTAEGKQDKLEKGFKEVTLRLEQMLTIPQPEKAVFSFKLLEKINGAHISNWVNQLMKNEDEVTRHFAQDRMNELKGLSVSDQYVIRMDRNKVGGGIKNLLSKTDLQFLIESGGDVTKARIQKLTKSSNPNDRHYATELLMHASKEEGVSFLMELLNDSEPKVRNTAIKTAVKRYNHEVLQALIENLGNPMFSNQAMNTLVLIGQESLPLLEIAFYRSGQNTQVMLKILQAVGRIGGQRAKEHLWNKIDYPNKMVVSQVLLSLGECGFKAGQLQATRIRYAIEADIADIRWNLSAIQEIDDDGFNDQVKTSLRWEVQNDIEHIYMLLAMLYDTRSIQLVKENIDSGTADSITYAVELLDVFLADQLKQRVIPVLDDLTDTERINRLDNFFPRVKLDSKLVLKFIINRDFTQSNRWTKACVIFQIGIQKIDDFKLDLIAQLFNPDAFIKEVSAWALYQINPDEYQRNVRRLGDYQRRELDDLVIHSKKMTRFEKVLFFQKIAVFENIPGITLSYLADISEEIRMNGQETLVLDEKSNASFYVLVAGSIDFYQRGQLVSQFTQGQFIGEMLGLPNFVNTNVLIAQSEVVILKLNKDQFYELLSDNVRLADKIIEFI